MRRKAVKVEIHDLGDFVAIPLPEEALHKLGVKEGDDVYVTETPTGLLLTGQDPTQQGE